MGIRLSTNDIRKLNINLTRDEMDSIYEYCQRHNISLQEFMYDAINIIQCYEALEDEYRNQQMQYGS